MIMDETRSREHSPQGSHVSVSRMSEQAAEGSPYQGYSWAQLHDALLEKERSVCELEVARRELLCSADQEKRELRERTAEEVLEYKEQSHQYALTISALEEKLLGLIKRGKGEEGVRQGVEGVGKGDDGRPSRVESSHDADRSREQLESVEKVVAVLRKQLVLASESADAKEEQLRQLRDDLATVQSQILHNEAELQSAHAAEVANLRLTLARQEEQLQSQRRELDQVQHHQLMREEEEEGREEEEVAPATEKVLDELSACGEKCIGEKHGNIIANQRTAISQLRRRVTELEAAQPPIGSHQATLRELARVRGELVRVRADSRLTAAGREGEAALSSQASVAEVEQLLAAESSEAALADSLREGLQCSEKSYNHLVGVVCKSLSLDTPPQPEGFAEADSSTKRQVLRDRMKFADAVDREIRKILTGPESSSASPTPSSHGDDPSETIAELEAALSSTAEELLQQKRLNLALARRKGLVI